MDGRVRGNQHTEKQTDIFRHRKRCEKVNEWFLLQTAVSKAERISFVELKLRVQSERIKAFQGERVNWQIEWQRLQEKYN